MRRLYGWLVGAAGGLAAYRALTRRRPAPPAAEPDERAEELRARLAESRAEADQADEPEGADERRRAIHEQGRAAIDEMRGGGESG